MKKGLLISILICISLVLGVVAAYTTTELLYPATNFATQKSTTVNVSGGINSSNILFPLIGESSYNDSRYVEVKIMNKSCFTCSYGNHSSYVIKSSNSTGDIFWSTTITLGSGYSWIFLNFTNVTKVAGNSYAGSATTARVINIDPQTEPTCNTASRGLIVYSDALGFRGCTTGGYKSLNQT